MIANLFRGEQGHHLHLCYAAPSRRCQQLVPNCLQVSQRRYPLLQRLPTQLPLRIH